MPGTIFQCFLLYALYPAQAVGDCRPQLPRSHCLTQFNSSMAKHKAPQKAPDTKSWQLIDQGVPCAVFISPRPGLPPASPGALLDLYNRLSHPDNRLIQQTAYCTGPDPHQLYFEECLLVDSLDRDTALDIARDYGLPAFLYRDQQHLLLVETAGGWADQWLAYQSSEGQNPLPISAFQLLIGYKQLIRAHFWECRELLGLVEVWDHPDYKPGSFRDPHRPPLGESQLIFQ